MLRGALETAHSASSAASTSAGATVACGPLAAAHAQAQQACAGQALACVDQRLKAAGFQADALALCQVFGQGPPKR